MKTAERMALLCGVSFLGAGAIAYFRGRRGKELVYDTLLHGAIASVGLNVVGWLVLESGEVVPVVAALNSAGAKTQLKKYTDMGKTTPEGLRLLEQMNVDTVLRDLKAQGVKIAFVPEDPSVIFQDPE
jgi:hypothetical protein